MATNESSHTQSASQSAQLTPIEMAALAKRLRARADSILLRDQPEQQKDMRAAAVLVEQLAQLRGDIQRLTDEVKDEVEEQHLRKLLGAL